MTQKFGCLVAGEWITSKQTPKQINVINPATEEVIAELPVATDEVLARALTSAERGLQIWRDTDAWTRSKILRAAASEIKNRAPAIARLLTEEQGKPLAEATVEVNLAAETIDWYADEARRIYGRIVDGHSRNNRIHVIRQPVGVVAAFTPWNFPCLLAARKLGGALAAGCSLILKPAEETPRSACAMVQAFLDAGLPPEVISVVVGNPEHISTTLIKSPIIKKISLTGSVAVGQQLMRLASDKIQSITLELGGHAPAVVFEDADLDVAADMIARGKFRNNGQVCIAPSRLFVHHKVADAFVSKFVDKVKALKIGNGLDEGIEIGPFANGRRIAAMESLLADATSKGAKLVQGGKRIARKGFFMEPAVLTGVNDSMRLMTEEPFCSIAPVITFTDFNEVIARANKTEFGLASYLFTRNTKTAFLASEQLETGMVGVNTVAISTAEAPFGGIKMSGFGREGGVEGIESYTVTKYINFAL